MKWSVDEYVGQQIRRKRLALGLTQAQLGARMGVSHQAINKYETAVTRLTAGRLYDVARHLGVPVGALFDGYEAKDQKARNGVHGNIG